MSAYNPPLFNNSAIQFNPTIYETGTTSTASQSLSLLKTNNIQCLLPNDTVSLYTVASGQVTLGTGGQGVKVVGLLSTSLANINGITTSNIDVQTGQTSIVIGTSATTVLIKPTTTQISGTLQTNTIDKYTSGPISLYQTAVGSVTLGANATGVDIQAIRISSGSIFPSSSQTLYIGNSNAPTIELGALSCTTLNIGSVNSTSYFKNSISAIFGVSPNTYSPVGTLTGCGMRLYNSGVESSFDLYSAGTSVSNAQPSSRFISNGGTALINTAALQIQADSIAIEPVGVLTLGSGTTTTTHVKSSSSVVIGTNPTSYDSGSSTASGKNIGTIFSASTQTDIKFWSADVATAQPSSSISANGGNTTANSGSLTLNAKNISLRAVDTASIVSFDATTINVGTSATTTVNVGTNAATTGILIGNSSVNPIKIQASDRVVIGNSPSTYNTSTTTLTGAGVIVGTNGPGPYNAFVDFYSNAGTLQSNSARIISNGDGLTIQNYNSSKPFLIESYQNLNLNAASGSRVNVNRGLYVNAGLAYGKGNLTNPSFTQTGLFGNGATTVPANSVVNYSATWVGMGLVNFGTAPTVICCNSCYSGLGQKLVISCYGATTTQVTFSLYNPSSTTTGSVVINITFIATGGY